MGMGNIAKTRAYLKRNGIVNTYYAAKERLSKQEDVPYDFQKLSDEQRTSQIKACDKSTVKFGVVVPVYETKEEYLRAMIESVLNQTYKNFELILADASVSGRPESVITSYEDERIVYVRLSENKGISENSNEALKHVTGDYTALLDHDDLLTEDALFEVATAILKARAKGATPLFIYSDEDKCNSDATRFYEPNIKPEFNLDYLLSNNYVCHLSVFESDLIKETGFRKDYDGAQDHDIILRTAGRLALEGKENEIVHISKVLYHWRCHEDSTAANPESKDYAYEAGRRAVEDFAGVSVSHTLHKGFFHADYQNQLFIKRKDVAAVGGFIFDGNRITGGPYESPVKLFCKNMNKFYSGYLHRAHCTMDMFALDIRTLTPNPSLSFVYGNLLFNCERKIAEIKSRKISTMEQEKLTEECVKKYSFEFAEVAREKNMRLLFDPKHVKWADYGYETKEDRLPVSVVVPNYNGAEFIKPCLDSLLATRPLPNEIIVVDNGSVDESAKILSEYEAGPVVKVIRHDKNLGFTGAVNHGIMSSCSPYVYLLNNDTTIEPDATANLVKVFGGRKKLFSAGSLMVSMDNKELIDNAGDYYNLFGYARAYKSGKSRLNYSVDKIRNTFSACAGAAMYRKDVLGKIGLFDDRHFAYLEDVDLGYRARIYGYKNVNAASSVVYHKGSAASGSKHNAFKVSNSSRNAVYVAMKNQPALQYICNFPFLFAGVLIKSLFFMRKGLGKEYVKGTFNGVKNSLSKEGFAHHVPFKLRYIPNYFKIQLSIIGSTLFFK